MRIKLEGLRPSYEESFVSLSVLPRSLNVILKATWNHPGTRCDEFWWQYRKWLGELGV